MSVDPIDVVAFYMERDHRHPDADLFLESLRTESQIVLDLLGALLGRIEVANMPEVRRLALALGPQMSKTNRIAQRGWPWLSK